MKSTRRQGLALGRYTSVVAEALSRLQSAHAVQRIWERDASLWKEEEAHQKIIRNSLGWLTVARTMIKRVDELEAFATAGREAGFTHVMLLGMGGSSLCPEVLRRTFGQKGGYPELLVLDTTDPDTIAAYEEHINLQHTLFIVSSKSGSTIEPLSFYKYFYDRVGSIKAEAGENFIAITDPGTLMEQTAREAGFRRTFLNPPDIGGRYSALSFFGMVPAALMGLDVREMLGRAVKSMEACTVQAAAENEGALLGSVMGALALQGRDKLTLVSSAPLDSLGLWIEQLVAESTGKEGKGIVPVAGEPLGGPEVYADDRIFVSVSVGDVTAEADEKLRALEAAGNVVVRRVLDDPTDLGAEFFVWEFATAVAGHLMGINPFDQPNVQESKDNTNRLLEEFKRTGALPEEKALVEESGLKIYGKGTGGDRSALSEKDALSSIIAEFLSRLKTGDYFALLAYLQETRTHDDLIEAVRTELRDSFRVATTAGYGPRYLHSTGQLHKGGADNGVFLELTDDDAVDLPIPGEPYTFSTLKQSQALGDFSSLVEHGRRALRVHLGRDAVEGLRKLKELLNSVDAQSRGARSI